MQTISELPIYICDTSSYPDDEDHVVERPGRNKRCKGVMRLDKLLIHIKAKHPESIPAKGRSLLQMGFTRATPAPPTDLPDEVDGDGNESDETDDEGDTDGTPLVAASDAARRRSAAAQGQPDAAESIASLGQEFWRSIIRVMDSVIKSNSTAQVIPSAEAIATEVLRQQRDNAIEQHGTGVSRE